MGRGVDGGVSRNGASPRLVDVTLRDGGKINGHCWTPAQAAEVVDACTAAGIRNTEVGYFRPARQKTDGETRPAASCPPRYLEALAQRAAGARLMVMTSRKDAEPGDLAALARHGVAMVNMPVRAGDVTALRPYAEAVRAAGMGLAVKLMRLGGLPEEAVLRASEQATACGAEVFYVADSYGGMFPEDVTRLAGRLREASGIPLGLHAHDGLSMAFANAIAALRGGFTYVDASLSGMGADGGNLNLELMAAYLRRHAGEDVRVAPLARAAAGMLTPWLGDGVLEKAAHIVIGMLDLDPKDPASAGNRDWARICAMLDAEPVGEEPVRE